MGAEGSVEIKNLSFSYGNNRVLEDVSFAVAEGKVTTILGSNGSGKSTLFYLMTKNLTARGGEILLDGKNINGIRLRDFAKRVSMVSQTNTIAGDVTVERLVSYGRTPFLSFMQRPGDEDRCLIEWAMEVTDVGKHRAKAVSTLSGGQRQRVWIAMALAQNTKLLLLDEPTTYLDIRYQIEILRLIRRLNIEFGITIVMVLHDMNQAIHYSDEILGLKDGRIAACGAPDEVFTPKLIEEIYGVRLKMLRTDDKPFVLQI
ncbi:MAG: ABC transporter ATP-binding protein [Clostridiales Family XIII bacterium]|jgi:iron complex transport system ATP-binding protein|nr:ABC transporter ATP-binding protein [Clostridiales Family XIII bacterium]